MGILIFLFERWRSYVDWRFDRQFSVDTSGTFSIPNAPAGANGYAGTPPYRFRSMVSDLAFNTNETTFIDFGCGKGRVLLMASQFGFKRVIGIEVSPELSHIAKKNVDSYNKKCGSSCTIQVLQDNAANFRIPHGKTVLYFYNPFTEDVMRAVLDNIQVALNGGLSEITIIYYNPLCSRVFDEANFLNASEKDASTRSIKALRNRPRCSLSRKSA